MALTHDKVLVGFEDGTLLCFESLKRNLLWTRRPTTRKIASVATMPDNTAFVLTDNSRLYKIRLMMEVLYLTEHTSYTTTTNSNNVIVNELGHIGRFQKIGIYRF